MIKFESKKVTIKDVLIITDDPEVSLDLTDRPVYELDNTGSLVLGNKARHLALAKARSFWEKVGFAFNLIIGKI